MEEQTERKRGAGAKQAYDVLRDEILDLVLAPGSLIDEVALAERFKMSRTPIREALVRLAGEGLIVTLPNRSTLVAQIDYLNMHTYFDALTLMYRVTSRLAAQYRTDADLIAIRAFHEEYAAAMSQKDALAMIASNLKFHAAIAEAGRNPYFTGLFRRLLDEGRRILRLYYQSFDDQFPERFVDEHRQLIDAIEKREADKADQIARVHAEQIVEQIKRLFNRGGEMTIAL